MAMMDFVMQAYSCVDKLDAKAFAEHFTEDARLTFANNPTVVGREKIAAGLGEFFSTLAKVEHEYRGRWEMGDVVILELKVTYTRKKDMRVVPISAASIIRLKGRAFDDVRIFIDMAPLFAD